MLYLKIVLDTDVKFDVCAQAFDVPFNPPKQVLIDQSLVLYALKTELTGYIAKTLTNVNDFRAVLILPN